ncbi:RNA polymerase sigma factor [Paludibaculum fermentans]|uniref:RNA polymerase sigma factor n=1 Tax=Paludibaculum fermentans TaxID=1473598 RepID=UPI003EBCF65C
MLNTYTRAKQETVHYGLRTNSMPVRNRGAADKLPGAESSPVENVSENFPALSFPSSPSHQETGEDNEIISSVFSSFTRSSLARSHKSVAILPGTRRGRLMPQGDDWDAEKLNELRRLLSAKARRLGSPQPEEAVQEVLARALANQTVADALSASLGRGSGQPAAEPQWLAAWLFLTLRNVVREQRRPESRGPHLTLDSTRGESVAIEPVTRELNPEEALVRRQNQAMLELCMKGLNRAQGSALRLFHLGIKQRDIAERLNVPTNTVASLIQRGRAQVSECLRRKLFRRPGAGGPEHDEP